MLSLSNKPKVEVLYVSDRYKEHRPVQGFEKNPVKLFNDITDFVFFLTASCNFQYCQHCCVSHHSHRNGKQVHPIMSEKSVFGLMDLLDKNSRLARQFTNSGGEVTLLDKRVRDYARDNNLISPDLAKQMRGHDYLPELIEREYQKITESTPQILRIMPTSSSKIYVRLPTNGFLFSWLENIPDLSEKGADNKIRGSLLYEVLSDYKGLLISMSVGPYQEIQYLRKAEELKSKGKKLGEHISLTRRIDELAAVQRVLRADSPSEYFGLGFMFTYSKPNLEIMGWDKLDEDIANRNKDISCIPSQNPEKNKATNYILGNYRNHIIEMQPVVKEGLAKNLPWSNELYEAKPKKILGETSELYLVPDSDGSVIHAYDTSAHMYQNNPDYRLFSLRFK